MSLLEMLSVQERDVNRVYGVSAAIVTNNRDPQGQGRLKLKFPWLSDDNETDWVRMATSMSGGGRGMFFLPEVGDEVLVAFEHGDINSPFVVGCLWNGKDKPPEDNKNGKNNIRKITSRSGHEIVLDDNKEQKKEKVQLKTNAGHTVLMDDAVGGEKLSLESKSGHKVVLNDAPGGEKIEIVDKNGTNKIVVDSLQNAITIECGMQLKIKANMVQLEGTASLSLKSNGMLTIQGTMVKIN